MLDNKVVPVEWLRKQFEYDPVTGKITNAETRKRAKAGIDPTYPCGKGYLAVKVYYQGERYTFMAHRLGWAIHHGKHPEAEIDHRKGKSNHLRNLRPATRTQNMVNRCCPKRGLPKGVTLSPRAKLRPYIAKIKVSGKTEYLGSFTSPKDAARAFQRRAREVHGTFSRTTPHPKEDKRA